MNLTPIVLIGSGMIAVALVFIVFARQRGGSWLYLGLGALSWIVTCLVIKFKLSELVEPLVYPALYVPGALWAPGSVLFYIYVGALTGVTEVLLTWLLLRYTRLGRVSWAKALAFGVGFGAIEALYMGFEQLASILTALSFPQFITQAALDNLQLISNPLYGLAPVADRLVAILAHIFCNALLFYGVTSGQARWLWISFAFKSLLDAIVGFAYFWGSETLLKIWTIEGLGLAFAMAAWWGTRQIRRRYALATGLTQGS